MRMENGTRQAKWQKKGFVHFFCGVAYEVDGTCCGGSKVVMMCVGFFLYIYLYSLLLSFTNVYVCHI